MLRDMTGLVRRLCAQGGALGGRRSGPGQLSNRRGSLVQALLCADLGVFSEQLIELLCRLRLGLGECGDLFQLAREGLLVFDQKQVTQDNRLIMYAVAKVDGVAGLNITGVIDNGQRRLDVLDSTDRAAGSTSSWSLE